MFHVVRPSIIFITAYFFYLFFILLHVYSSQHYNICFQKITEYNTLQEKKNKEILQHSLYL